MKSLDQRVFDHFCMKEGNQHIASQNALKGIRKIICRYHVTKVLELGIGIGTIPYFLHQLALGKKLKIQYTGTEGNDYCIQQFTANLPPAHDHFSFRHYSDLSAVPKEKYDLIIIDGSDNHISQLYEYCNSKTILFVEGDRKKQRELIMEIFNKNGVINCYHAISNQKNKPNSPFAANKHVGGYTVFFFNPSFEKKLFRLYNKVLTALKYRIRPILN